MKRTAAPNTLALARNALNGPVVIHGKRITLTAEQRAIVLDVVMSNQHVLLTGPGGVGKSVLFHEIVRLLGIIGGRRVVVTASTGVAANPLDGMTIAQCMGTMIHGDVMTDEEARDLGNVILKDPKKRYVRERMCSMTDLLIDEVSMVRARMFDNVNTLLQVVRQRRAVPFGGVRLILGGDFFQLPPVVTEKELAASPGMKIFAFQADSWDMSTIKVHELVKSHRHAGAPTFSDMLMSIREGIVTDEIDAALQARVLPVPAADADNPVVYVYPKNYNVDKSNLERVHTLPGELKTLRSIDQIPTRGDPKQWLKDVRAPAELLLKVGAQVMLLRNLTRRDLDELLLEPIPTDLCANTGESSVKVILSNGSIGTVLRFEQLNENSAHLYPVVYFAPRGASPLTVRIKHHQFEQREHPRGPVVATRTQFPLQLCYAFSAHKSQGQTILCNVVADLASSFAYGQAYVMLSRVCALEQLYLSSYHRAAIKAHPDVTRFYQQLRLAAKQ